MLYKGNQGIVERSSRKLTMLLDEREKRWNDTQKKKAQQRIESKLSKALHTKDYTRKRLQVLVRSLRITRRNVMCNKQKTG